MVIRIRPSHDMLSKLSELPERAAYKALREDMGRDTHRLLKIGPLLIGERSDDYTRLTTKLGVRGAGRQSLYDEIEAEYAQIVSGYVTDDTEGINLVEVLNIKGGPLSAGEELLRARKGFMQAEAVRMSVGVLAIIACLVIAFSTFIGGIEKTGFPNMNPIIVPDEMPEGYPYKVGIEYSMDEA